MYFLPTDAAPLATITEAVDMRLLKTDKKFDRSLGHIYVTLAIFELIQLI